MVTNASIWAWLKDAANNDVWPCVVGSGAPTDGTSGTGVAITGPSSLYFDFTNIAIYINTNTKASPTWQKVWSLVSGAVIIKPVLTYSVQSAVAAGSTQGTAVAITATAPGNILITAADGTKGAILPAATAGKVYNVKNADAANNILKVYPATGENINALSSNTAISMAAKTSAVFWCITAGTWYTTPLLPS
jgi:hypothetical protein